MLSRLVNIYIVTADTRGVAQELGKNLPFKIHKVNPGDEQAQKLRLAQQLGLESTVTIGNGANDASILRESALGICIIGVEGTAAESISSCDLIVPDINAALDLLIKTERLIATLRR